MVVGLPLVGQWARRHAPDDCAYDGVAINPHYRVEVVDSRGFPHGFCCITCARNWLRHEHDPRAITVTDEASGQAVDAEKAWYVRSSVETVQTTGNRIHAFRNREDAERHARAFWGVVLPESENPLRPER
jgi:hypothetical protein